MAALLLLALAESVGCTFFFLLLTTQRTGSPSPESQALLFASYFSLKLALWLHLHIIVPCAAIYSDYHSVNRHLFPALFNTF